MAAVTPEPYLTGNQPPGMGTRVDRLAARRCPSRPAAPSRPAVPAAAAARPGAVRVCQPAAAGPSARSLGPAPRELVVASGAIQPRPLPPGLVGGLRRQL